MKRKKWRDLSPRTRRFLIIGGAIDGALKLAALIDLVRRPRSEVRGRKEAWAAAVLFVNSLGVLPTAYFLRGRRSSPPS